MMARRRLLSQQRNNCPYIKDGLIFWLDGINKGNDPEKWVDLIGNREFVLTDCSFLENGVVFTQTSKGDYLGAIGNSALTDTIECAVNRIGTTMCILYPTNKKGGNFITMVHGAGLNFGWISNGSVFARGTVSGDAKLISASNELIIANGVRCGYSVNDTWSSNTTDYTGLGYRPHNGDYHFSGIMYSVRIYNRHLTEEEMIHNQKVDNQRFNLGVTIA